jgi:hypothetical protein
MSNEELAMSNESNNELIEMRIIGAVRGILTGRVNEVLGNWQFMFGIFEDSEFKSNTSIVPVVKLLGCERTEKERIICIDAYSLTISLTVPETADSEFFCYGYSSAISKALGENPTLGGIVNRVTVADTKYIPPKVANCGQDWQVIITLRLTVEGTVYAS